jgi:arginine decarboxylase
MPGAQLRLRARALFARSRGACRAGKQALSFEAPRRCMNAAWARRTRWRIGGPTLQYARPVGPAAFQASDRRFSFVKARRCDVLISLSGGKAMTKQWSVEAARGQYAVNHWGEGYFDVDERGRLAVRPRGADGPMVALPEIVEAARARGSRLPLLVRFADILRHRLARLQRAFATAMREWDYAGGYSAVYPVKVNQQKGVVGELAAAGGSGFGLEAGSKPELMAVLAFAQPGSIVICNGYKDREYLRLALIGRKLGLRVFIVIEKPSELAPAIAEARALEVEPLFGVRMRLTSLGAGKWQNTGGEKSKFGLTPR